MVDGSGTRSRNTVVAAPPERVWQLVSDLPGMGAFSPENAGGSWRGGATGPAVGAIFLGATAPACAAGRRRAPSCVASPAARSPSR